MNLKQIILMITCLLSICPALTAETVKVKKAVGRWEVSDDVTPKQAEERALNEAKKEALRKAGVMENVWSVFGQVTSDNGNEFFEAYSSVSTLAINGMVNVTDMKVNNEYDPNLNRIIKIVTIDADVIKDNTREDLTYTLDVEDLKPVYSDGEEFNFKFRVHGHDSYIKIFWFGDDGADMIYPRPVKGHTEVNRNRLFFADETYVYPLDNTVMRMQKATPPEKMEKVNFIVVATKKDYPYTGENDFQSIIKWIFSLPADQRAIFNTLTLIK